SSWGYVKQKDYYNLDAGSYTFRIRAKDEAGNIGYLNYSFNIVDNSPPVITNVNVNPAQQIENGYVNITCDITDDFGISLAKAIMQYPDASIHEFNLHHSSYYLNQTYSMVGIYYFYIYAMDVNGNDASSSTYQFEIIPPDTTPPVITLEDYPPSVINYRDVHFEWNATDDTTEYQNILFSYKLDGYDAGWSSWGYVKQKDYYNLDAGSYTFRIRAKDEAGNIGYLNYSFNIVDNTPPVITDVNANPSENLIDGYINITCNITDDFGISLAKAIIQYPDSKIHEFNMHHSSYYLNQTYSMAGIYYFYIYAKDIYNNEASSSTFQFEIIDEIPPVITDVAVNPSTQDVGRNVTFSCVVTDNVEVEDVFLNISYPDGSYSNFSIKQNHTGDTYYCSKSYNIMGTYEFFIYAVDTSGNSNVSDVYQFEITDLSPPEINNIDSNPLIQDIGKYVNISCIVTDNVEVEDVFLNISYPDGSYSNFSIKQNHTGDTYYCSKSYNIMGTYEFFIYAVDTSGNSNVSDVYQFEITDLSPPDVDVIYPTGNESLRNGVLIQWNATDNSNTILITIKYSPNNGATWHKIVENTENDGEYMWNTSGLEDGKNYLIEISAIDTAGNIGKGYSNKFTVDNTKPSIEITKPVIGKLYMFDREILPIIGSKAVIIGKITIEVEANDATSGMEKVEFYIDGKYNAEDTSSPYRWVWDERSFGKHTIKVIAYDKAGNKINKEIEVFIVNFL
ncbi:MAG TPA: hypothetical protein ENI33_03095, partial [Thermoplasmatales archaeon]|nr:hypothetical protein [Thermoplasmatales archaeon]